MLSQETTTLPVIIIITVLPWYSQCICPQTHRSYQKLWDAQVPCVQWHGICVWLPHILLCTLHQRLGYLKCLMPCECQCVSRSSSLRSGSSVGELNLKSGVLNSTPSYPLVLCDLGQVDLTPLSLSFLICKQHLLYKVACEGHRRHLGPEAAMRMLSTEQWLQLERRSISFLGGAFPVRRPHHPFLYPRSTPCPAHSRS